ncbi:MAG: hypothetical protein DRP12_01775 [Candidatus Aenigmatarchaeota archaeon]|nr:MAG: hypothetical protein DRP12_01775 [Candidatus Aenigmarchaeota archaeon]
MLEIAKRTLFKSRILWSEKVRGAFKSEGERDRYPFIYPRDASRIGMALDKLGKHDWVERHYFVLSKLQFHTGEFAQRYDYEGKPKISRPKETDATALALCGICQHFLETGRKQFLQRLLPTLELGLKYLKHQLKENGLVYGMHAIHESQEIENGYEIWTNCWTCQAFRLSSEVFSKIGRPGTARRLGQTAKQLYEKIMEKFWNGKHFIKCIRPDGSIVDGKIISIIAPAWSGILPDDAPEMKKTVRFLRPLWDRRIGGYQRFRKLEWVKDWHWYDGGSGSWLNHTILMARLHANQGQKEKAKECLRWIRQVTETFGSLPEHVSLWEEYLEWKENELKTGIHVTPWLKIGMKNAEKNAKRWRWAGKSFKVVPWVKSIIWPSAELVLNWPILEEIWKCL